MPYLAALGSLDHELTGSLSYRAYSGQQIYTLVSFESAQRTGSIHYGRQSWQKAYHQASLNL